MDFKEKLAAKAAQIRCESPLKIAFLGDSVTHGCFELVKRPSGSFDCIYDHDALYSNRLRLLFAQTFPGVPVSVINAGISGDNAPGGAARLERDIISCRPDLVVVCYGLNDVCGSKQTYLDALRDIFTRLAAAGIQTVFMTPNMMCSYADTRLPQEWAETVNEKLIPAQTDGKMDDCIYSAARLAESMGVTVCDCYTKWKKLAAAGCDTTALLANYINHPSRPMHRLFAVSLYETIMGL